MNAADILILAVLAISMLFGLLRGFVGEVLSLACWVAAFWVAWAFGHEVALLYARHLGNPTASILAGYVTCFLGVLVIGSLLGWTIRRLMARGGLRGDDRLLGMVFGLARGLVLVTFVVLMLGFTRMPQEPGWRQSVLLQPFERAARWTAQALPPDVTAYFEMGAKALPGLPKIPISGLPGTTVPDTVPARAGSSARPVADKRADGNRARPVRDDVGQ